MKFLSESISRKVGGLSLGTQEKAPQILFGAGIACMVASTVHACRSTLKVEEVLDEIQNDIRVANATQEQHPEKYSEKELSRDKTIVYARGGAKMVKLYAPSLVLGGVGIVCLTKSHTILQDRYAGMVAAYTALDRGFREYRQRVVDKYGEEQDQEFRYDTEVYTTTDKGGKKKTHVRVGEGAGHSVYAKFFDEYSPRWSKEPEYNAYFLKCQQNYWNDILNSRGHVFLNEVYDELGIPRTQAGCVVGWLRGNGDNYIDFGIFNDSENNRIRDFVNGREASILLDFNVDGPIFHKIEDLGEPLSWQLQQ